MGVLLYVKLTEDAENTFKMSIYFNILCYWIFTATTFSVEGQVTQIEVKNPKLFGERFVNLQTFEEKKDQQDIKSAFIDSLTVDQYGFVFVDDVPRRNHQFAIGDDVQCKDGSKGHICDLNADQICIKIKGERRWIKKSMIPIEVTLTFPHQGDIGKYEFTLSARVDGDAQNELKDLKRFTFSNIKRLKIPYPLMRNDPAKVYSFGVYAKPKAIDVPMIKIKSIEYPPFDETELVISNTESIVNHLIVTLKQTRTEIRDAMAFLNLFGLHPDDQSKWMYLIVDHSMLFDVTAYRKQMVIERLIVELKLMNKEWLQVILKQKKQNKSLLDWLVEDRKLLRLFDFYRVLSPKFKIEKYSKLLNCSWLSVKSKNEEMEKEFGINEEVDAEVLKKSEHRINGKLVPFAPIVIDDLVQTVTVTNPNVFDGEEFTLQQFDQKEEEKKMETELYFRDMLGANKSGVISIEFTVGRKVQINENGKWIRGVVSQLMVDKICVKTGEKNLFSFRWIENDRNSTKIKFVSFDNERELKNMEFAARAGRKEDVDNLSNLKRFTFDDVNAFRIPPDLLVATSSTADAIHIYAKPKATELNFHRIKTVAYQCGPLFFSRYHLDRKDPFCINEEVKVRSFSESLKRGGEFEVITSSAIIISKTGTINASGGVMMVNAEQSNGQSVKVDIGGSDGGVGSGNEAKISGVGGGTISLFADGNVVNEGSLLCRASNNGMFSRGTVRIMSGEVFENKGLIDGDKNGTVHIGCAHFVNSGQIEPVPNVVMWSGGSVASMFEQVVAAGSDKQIKLEYEKHRGHLSNSSSYHPRNLLQEGTRSEYVGKKPVVGDWITFRLQSEERVLPTKIGIRNDSGSSGLKTVSISGSADNKEFEELVLIQNIHRKNRDMQTFDIDPRNGFIAWRGRFQFFRIEVVQNYGDSNYNAFCEFRIYGIRSE